MNVENDAFENESHVLTNHVDEEQYLRSLGLFYLKLQAKVLLPASTIQAIIEEFQNIHDIGQSHLFGRLKDKLAELNVSDEDASSLIEEVCKGDLLHACNSGSLRSDQTRKTVFQSHFDFVEPVEIYLGQDENGKHRFGQYVPVKKTLQALFKHASVKDQYNVTHATSPKEGIFEDISDGKVFLSNSFFRDNPSALRLLLYQDSFEVVNTLGSGKNKQSSCCIPNHC